MSVWSEINRRNVAKMAVLYGVSGWLILQMADLLFDLLGLPDWTLRLVLGILLLGFPVALVFSWLYELTPEGLKREKDVDRSVSITQNTGRRLNLVTLTVAFVAIAMVIFQQFRPAPSPDATLVADAKPAASQTEGTATETPADRTIAVLPFENRSPDPDNAYFADGIHDDLLTSLAKIGDLVVISRTSVLKYRSTEQSIPDIARELSVAHVLEGAVQRSGDQVRINVQLIEASTDKHLWAEIFDRQLTTQNLFAIQTEIATAIAKALAATLSPDEKARLESTPTDNLTAYEFFLKGRRVMHTRHPDDLATSIAMFEEAVALDSNFAPALAQLASAKILLAQYGGGDRDAAQDEARVLLDQALASDPTLGIAHAVRGMMLHTAGDHEASAQAYERALELDPNLPEAYLWYGRFLRLVMDDPERALILHRKAMVLDPGSAVIHINTLDSLFDMALVDEALAKATAWVAKSPEAGFAHMWLSAYNGEYTGDRVAELRHMLDAAALVPRAQAAVCRIILELGSIESGASCLESARDQYPESDYAMMMRFIALARSDPQGAVEAVKSANRLEPGDQFTQLELIEMLLAAGEVSEATIVAESLFPGLLETGELANMDVDNLHYWRMVAGRILQHNGRIEEGNALIEQSLAFFEGKQRLIHFDYQDIMALSSLGRTEEALAALVELVDANWSSGWQYFRESNLVADIREHPVFKEQMRRVEARVAEQRALAEAEGLL
jgi:TolB-like protein